MNKANELREQRAGVWEKAKKFLDTHRNENNMLSSEDTQTYERMENEIVNLGKEIERQERLEKLERELNSPINSPLTTKPGDMENSKKKGRGSNEYTSAFWKQIRARDGIVTPEIRNALRIGVDTEGGYLVPDEFERMLVEALEEENIFRTIAHKMNTASGDKKIPIVSSKGSASWIDEGGAYPESDDAFGQVSIGAHKVGTMIKVSEELINDNVFDLEGYIAKEFGRRIGAKEEEAFFSGDGSGKPLGILAASGGAKVGVTSSLITGIKFDEIIDLFYSLKAPYRKNATWIVNDTTIKALRKLKDGNGQYIWQPSVTAGTPDSILNRPVQTSSYMPELTAGNKSVVFGDFSYYWIADRQGRVFKRLGELYAPSGQVGFLGSQRVDGKLILPEAVKVLQQKVA
ncbi:MAG: phage major capsid protein [Fusobacterium sp. JB020]|nr:phage major capsid protein [Fusobacterium sp. JB020]